VLSAWPAAITDRSFAGKTSNVLSQVLK